MKYVTFLSALICTCLFFIGCEQKINIQTIVHNDGSIDRTILISEVDSSKAIDNIFKINQTKGWATEIENAQVNEKEKKFNIKFSKTFASIAAANTEMSPDDEDVFKIHSELIKNFRWFYTYYRYTDTYKSLNRLHHPNQEDYFTKEDYAFIDRLPSEGSPISKADSLYLEKLNEKIFDHYGLRGFYEEYIQALFRAMKANKVEPQWIDSILVIKDDVFFSEVMHNKDFEDDFVITLLQRFNIPFSISAITETYQREIKEFEGRQVLMTESMEGRFVHSIQLPWQINESNADSVYQNVAFWKPPVIKFTLRDYIMYAEGRELNGWAITLSVLVVLVTVWLFFRASNQQKLTARMEN